MNFKIGDRVVPKKGSWYEEGCGKTAIVVEAPSRGQVFVKFEDKMEGYQRAYYCEGNVELAVNTKELL
jgi:hypothetical protein